MLDYHLYDKIKTLISFLGYSCKLLNSGMPMLMLNQHNLDVSQLKSTTSRSKFHPILYLVYHVAEKSVYNAPMGIEKSTSESKFFFSGKARTLGGKRKITQMMVTDIGLASIGQVLAGCGGVRT